MELVGGLFACKMSPCRFTAPLLTFSLLSPTLSNPKLPFPRDHLFNLLVGAGHLSTQQNQRGVFTMKPKPKPKGVSVILYHDEENTFCHFPSLQAGRGGLGERGIPLFYYGLSLCIIMITLF